MRKRMTDWLAAEGCIGEDEKQAYGYATASLVTACRPVAVFLVIAAAANRLVESLVMLFVFMNLRRMSGGYHAKTPLRCFLVSLTVFCIGLAAASMVTGVFVWDMTSIQQVIPGGQHFIFSIMSIKQAIMSGQMYCLNIFIKN